jgi:hypothetical protein
VDTKLPYPKRYISYRLPSTNTWGGFVGYYRNCDSHPEQSAHRLISNRQQHIPPLLIKKNQQTRHPPRKELQVPAHGDTGTGLHVGELSKVTCDGPGISDLSDLHFFSTEKYRYKASPAEFTCWFGCLPVLLSCS